MIAYWAHHPGVLLYGTVYRVLTVKTCRCSVDGAGHGVSPSSSRSCSRSSARVRNTLSPRRLRWTLRLISRISQTFGGSLFRFRGRTNLERRTSLEPHVEPASNGASVVERKFEEVNPPLRAQRYTADSCSLTARSYDAPPMLRLRRCGAGRCTGLPCALRIGQGRASSNRLISTRAPTGSPGQILTP